MYSLSFIGDFAWFLGVGALAAAAALRLRQPVILGYLAAGVMLGPHGFLHGFLKHPSNIEILGQLGIVFLMFFLGTEFHLRKLKALGPAPILAGVLELTLVALAGFELGRLLGLDKASSIFVGFTLCMCSTTILVKSLSDLKLLREDFAGLAVGLTLVEDMATVLILIAASSWATSGTLGWVSILGTLGNVTAFSAAVLILGLGLGPRLFGTLNQLASGEVLAAAVVGFGVALSALAASLGFSSALGAFLSGMVIADSGVMPKLQEKLAGFRDLFVGLFFVTVGFQTDFSGLGSHWPLVLAVFALVVGGKVLSVSTASLLIGFDTRTSLRTGLAMSNIGEFSFVVAGMGVAQGILPPVFLAVVVAASAATVLTTSQFMKHGGGWATSLEARIPSGVRTFHARYQSWLKALRWPLRRFTLPKNLWPLAMRALVLLACLGFLGPSLPWFRQILMDHQVPIPGGDRGLRISLEASFAVAFLSFYLLFLRTLQRLFRHVLKSKGETMDRKGQTLLKLWMFVAAVGTATLFLAAAAPFTSIWTTLAILAGVGVYLGGGLKRTLAIMDTRLDSFVDQLVRSAEGAPGDRATFRNLLQERYPLSAVVMDFMLPPNPTAANLSLAELKLRKTTGATVVSVYRGEACLANPAPDFRILPGDVLCLLGEKEHVQAAFAYLNGLCRQPPPVSQVESIPQLETVRIPADSPLIGRSFRDLSLRNHTGATVVGLERKGSLNTAPSPDAPLEGEDVLLLLGNQEAVNRARRLISVGDLSADASLDDQVEEAQLRG